MVLCSIFMLIAIRRMLERRGFAAVIRRLRRFSKRKTEAMHRRVGVDDICLDVERTADTLPGYFSCLTRALVGYAICSRNAHRTSLRIGVRRIDEFHAHAWLEYEGRAVVGDLSDLSSFDVFDRSERLLS